MQHDPIRRDGTRVAYGAPTAESALASNKVLRNTYTLLSMTLLFSAAMAGLSMMLQLPYFGPFITLGVYFGLLFLTNKMRNSAAGIVCVFALTGFMGLTLGPILSMYMQNIPNGGDLIILKALLLHYMTPVTGGVTDGEEDRLLLGRRLFKGLL